MQLTKANRTLLIVGGALAATIGGTILFAPGTFHATNGITLGRDTNLLSEVRAPGGALLAFGLIMWLGALRRRITAVAMTSAATVFLAYGAARVLSIGLDGVPGPGLLAATVIELTLGVLFLMALVRAGPDAAVAAPIPTGTD